MTSCLRVIHNAWDFQFALVLVFKVIAAASVFRLLIA
ncbi:DUF3265 domain-containing protein [Photobacterium kasasachensis]